MKKITLLFLLSISCVFAQTPTLDSLKLAIKESKVDSTRVSLNFDLARAYFDYDISQSKRYGSKALEISLKSNRYKLTEVYSLLGVLEFESSNVESARDYYDKALKELDTHEDKQLRSVIYGNYSSTYENTNNYEKELAYSLKAIELSKDNPKELGFLYFNHSIIYEDAGFHEESLHYLKLANQNSKEFKDYRIEMYSLRQLSYYAIEAKAYESAKTYLKRGLEICEITKSKENCFHIYVALGILNTEIGDYNKAEAALLEAKSFALSRNLEDDIITSEVLIANLEFKRGNFKKATQIYNTLKIPDHQIDDIRVADMVFKNRSKAESAIGNYKKSNGLLFKYLKVSDSIRLSKNRYLLVQADRKYQIEKKDKELVAQELELQQQDHEIQKKSSQMTLLYGLLIFLVVLSILGWLAFQQKQKRKNQELITLKRESQVKSLEALIEGEEKERFRISKELHDGVNGDLSAIKFKLSSLLEMNNKVIKEAITMIDSSCEQVRAISHNLVPPSLENFNLVDATENYCHNLDTINTQHITFQYIGLDVELSKKAEINVFRIIQELVTNALKHAEASEITVQISYRDAVLQITVEDDGKGFDRDAVKTDGIGLDNIQSRVDYLNATLDVISNSNGTSYTIDMDLKTINDN